MFDSELDNIFTYLFKLFQELFLKVYGLSLALGFLVIGRQVGNGWPSHKVLLNTALTLLNIANQVKAVMGIQLVIILFLLPKFWDLS